jgi:hypothetical protein
LTQGHPGVDPRLLRSAHAQANPAERYCRPHRRHRCRRLRQREVHGSTVDPNATEVSPAGDIPDNQAYVAYRPPGGGYSVKVPEGWARTAQGGAVAFTDKLNRIRMESSARDTALTVAAARKTSGGLPAAKVSAVRRKAGPAILTTFLRKAQPDAVTGKAGTDAVERYAFFHNGREVILTLSGPKGADNVDPWRIVTDSLRFTR